MTKRLLSCLGMVILIVGTIVSPRALAVPGLPLGGWTSPNVEWLANLPQEGVPTALDSNLVGKKLYVSGTDDTEIFDVSDPTKPVLLSRIPKRWPSECEPVTGTRCWRNTPVIAGTPFFRPDWTGLDTNGRILLTAGSDYIDPSEGDFYTPKNLYIYDVSDPSAPDFLSELTEDAFGASAERPGRWEFLGWRCVLDCRWAYGITSGSIVDLRDPLHPSIAGWWRKGLTFQGSPAGQTAANDVVEIRPGILLTSSIPMYLLDARKFPARPKLIARSDGSPNSFGSVGWARRGKDTLIVSSGEGFPKPARCEDNESRRGTYRDTAWKTWDASNWERTGLLTGLREHRPQNGTYVDGDPAFSGADEGFWGCSTGLIDLHPHFANGGLVASGAWGHGTKFLRITRSGDIEEAGFFLPYGGSSTVGALWITDEIVYTFDIPRGIDILRFDRSG